MHIAKILTYVLLMLFSRVVAAQSVEQKLSAAYARFEADPQLQFAISSLYVVNAATGKPVFEKSSRIGLAPASTQKIITSATAFALLGKEYRFKTAFGYDRRTGSLQIEGSGDPTLGSDRYAGTNAASVMERVVKKLPAGAVVHSISINPGGWNMEGIPGGWLWQDLANYYGAAAAKLNWRENKFDLVLQSGRNIGDPVTVVATMPDLSASYPVRSVATAAAKGTGDNAYIYFPVGEPAAIVRGTIPVSESRFIISGALPAPAQQMAQEIADTLARLYASDVIVADIPGGGEPVIFHTERSPSLDSIIYWFNRRSINLYGEALLKIMALEKKGIAASDSGISVIRDFWKQYGIHAQELNMIDGSGLSPLNRLTTQAQVAVLKFARSQPWFASFEASLPLYNGMKMKSGTITGVKGFSGYHTSATGTTYVFSFVVNNYNGSARSLVNKMYRVLDTLK